MNIFAFFFGFYLYNAMEIKKNIDVPKYICIDKQFELAIHGVNRSNIVYSRNLGEQAKFE